MFTVYEAAYEEWEQSQKAAKAEELRREDEAKARVVKAEQDKIAESRRKAEEERAANLRSSESNRQEADRREPRQPKDSAGTVRGGKCRLTRRPQPCRTMLRPTHTW